MTAVEIHFRYGNPPTSGDMRGVGHLRDVYGIRRISFNENERTVKVEYDASRLKENTVAALLRRAGVDVREKLALA
jgi:hypothetical protein